MSGKPARWNYEAIWKRRVDKAFQSVLSVPGEHIMWVLGVSTFDAALEKLEDRKLAGVAEKVKCPYPLTHGERDEKIPLADAQALFITIGATDKTMKVFTVEEGGYERCQGDKLTLGITTIADWLRTNSKARYAESHHGGPARRWRSDHASAVFRASSDDALL